MKTRFSFALLFLLLALTGCRNSFFGDDPDDRVPQRSVLEFDGVDDQLMVTQAPSLNFDGAFTVEAWIYPHDVKNNPGGSERTILRKGFSTEDTTDYRQTTNYHLFFNVRRGSGVLAFQGAQTSKQAVQKDEWQHVAGVFNPQDSSSTIYINGEKAARVSGDSFPVPNTAPLVIGLSLEQGGAVQDMYDGLIRNVRLWNTARTPAQLRETMRQTLMGNEAGLVASWAMDAGRGQAVIDAAGAHPAVLGSTDASEDNDPKWEQVDDPDAEQ
ncbi:MAG: LamG domain-containing protein [Rhodothermales bacterium]